MCDYGALTGTNNRRDRAIEISTSEPATKQTDSDEIERLERKLKKLQAKRDKLKNQTASRKANEAQSAPPKYAYSDIRSILPGF